MGEFAKRMQAEREARELRDMIGDYQRELPRLKAAMMEAIGILGGLSMATEGAMRGRICSVSNCLNAALGRTQSYHGDEYADDGKVLRKSEER